MELKGRLTNIRMYDRHTGILQADVTTYLLDGKQADGESVIVHGPVRSYEQNELYIFDGQMHNGIFAFSYARRTAEGAEDSVSILAGAHLGVSRQKAAEIVSVCGNDLFSYAEDSGFRVKLQTIKGIGEKKARAIEQFIRQNVNKNALFQFLYSYDTPVTSIMKIIEKDGKQRPEDIKENPYALLDFDVPFSVCDRIAEAAGIDAWAKIRIKGAVRACCLATAKRGSTREELSDFTVHAAGYADFFRKNAPRLPKELTEIAAYTDRRIRILNEDGRKYAADKALFQDERNAAENILRICQSAKPILSDTEKALKVSEKESGIRFNGRQREVFSILASGGAAILTGGPGTGKTAVIAGIVKACQILSPETRILLAAPTGRAASRMSEMSGAEARTIHKALNLKWFNDREDEETDPLPYDLVIADEMSMCDTHLFKLFTGAIQNGTTVLFAGDANQLPSVGPGEVLRNLIDSGKIPVYHLTELVRQGKDSMIARNADRILHGLMPETGEGFTLINASDSEKAFAVLKALTEKKLKETGSVVQVLCPIRKTGYGTFRINSDIQKMLNFRDTGVILGGQEFHRGDKVIMNENRYDIGYMNGDIGEITDMEEGGCTIQFTGKNLTIPYKDADGMSLAYALTVHKSQGSECEEAVLFLPEESDVMASRELFYTAVTRAKKAITVISAGKMLSAYLAASGRGKRKTGLAGQIKNLWEREGKEK